MGRRDKTRPLRRTSFHIHTRSDGTPRLGPRPLRCRWRGSSRYLELRTLTRDHGQTSRHPHRSRVVPVHPQPATHPGSTSSRTLRPRPHATPRCSEGYRGARGPSPTTRPDPHRSLDGRTRVGGDFGVGVCRAGRSLPFGHRSTGLSSVLDGPSTPPRSQRESRCVCQGRDQKRPSAVGTDTRLLSRT